jgi:mono/diheme cytochrome c family protein
MMNLQGLIVAVESSEPVSSGSGIGVGAAALSIAVVLLLGWMAFLYVNSRRTRAAAQEAAPPNLAQPISEDELENAKLTRVLRAALFGSILLAVALPWYAINEPDRQAEAADMFLEEDIEAGAHFFSLDGFQCSSCHGPDAGGGSAEFTEARSGVGTAWAVPSLNDIFFRYDDDEVRHWIEFGRAGTPMPANGLEGGGSMTVQEVDQVMEYLRSIQVSQADAFAKSAAATSIAISAIEGGADATQKLIDVQKAMILLVKDAGDQLAVVGTFPDDIKDLLQGEGTCTEESAALVLTTCDNPASDADKDGLADVVEGPLSKMARIALDTVTGASGEAVAVYNYSFNPGDAFTNEDANRQPLPDLDAAEDLLTRLETEVLLLTVTSDREDDFLEGLNDGLAFLEAAAISKLWEVDYDAKASEMGVSVEQAMEAAGLFNGYCARCHTGGYSAGAAFEQGAGTGAWGPSLLAGRTVSQFPEFDGHYEFVLSGSTDGKRFGVNGLGTGRMPSFGQILSESQINLIVMYERTL